MGWPVPARIAGAVCCQLATRAVSLMLRVDVNPKPPSLIEVNSWMLSLQVNVRLSHCSKRLEVIVSRVFAVAESRPIARAVKDASPVVAVRHRAWATCVVSP